MKLIGMLDSPYVRRVAISLAAYGVAFEHRPLSVFSDYAAFAELNPAVKAPTLLLDDGTVLMDSTLILHYLEAQADAAAKLCPRILRRWRKIAVCSGWRSRRVRRRCSTFTSIACGRRRRGTSRG